MIKEKILKAINNKYISIERYTEICLYAENGYYKQNNIIGKNGDFITAPEISQLYGEIIGLYIFSIWKNEIQQPFNLIELGPGNGTLLIDILNITKNFISFNNSKEIYLIEKNINLIKKQKINIKKSNVNYKNIHWKDNFSIPSNKPSIIYANEFFDCLPIRQFYKENKKWFEKMIGYSSKNKNFFLKDIEIVNKKILSYINNYDPVNILEISETREKYFNDICKHLISNGGMILIADYGYFDRPNYFTIQSLYNKKKSNILDNPGKQDITSLLDFKQFIKIAKKNNLKIDIFCSQREFLLMHGIKDRAKKIYEKATKKQQKTMEEGLKRLINESDMGSIFKILIISK